MGKLIECFGKIAEKPYHFRLTDTNVYSIEEVCYYVYNNIYIIQEEIFDSAFTVWLRDELNMDIVADKIDSMRNDKNNLKDIVVTICCSCDYYDEEQINELIGIMDAIADLSKWEKAKIKADNYCRFGSYEKAIEEYTQILGTDDMLNATEEDYGAVYHNMGTAFCGMGLFIKASDSFEHAYEKNRKEESLRSYFYALKLTGDKKLFDKGVKKFDIDIKILNNIMEDFAKTDEETRNSKEIRRIMKLEGIMKAGYVEEYYEKVGNYINQWKEDYRNEIVTGIRYK